ncbi:GAF and ANTAR domain-containing protein [Pseudonocardia kujensis]|uniref:GAF and ANTAR domain-containing protein n=1 Tax=Pseudonocardia kujensis TaxID=1128675 RepID=UPI001E58D11C|nr:GAF and ANTAR domain-containing protein [Pseudonocardia kujensis]MCE0768065.1 GAF and ANTAR domain-containing protein [Pseudonocardia kujensis]
MAQTDQETLARLLLQVARQLEAEDGRVATQERITRVAVGTVPGCRHAAMSLVRAQGPIRTVAATDELPERVDEVQYRTGQGPCLQAIETQVPYRTGDLATEERWPDFAKAAVEETGVRSMLSFRLFVREDTIGALNLYSCEVEAFDHRSFALGALLAGHAALAMVAAREKEHARDLDRALESSRDIGVAMGILMAGRRLSRDAAFEELRRTSQQLNTKLRTVAEFVAATGALPRRPLAPRLEAERRV